MISFDDTLIMNKIVSKKSRPTPSSFNLLYTSDYCIIFVLNKNVQQFCFYNKLMYHCYYTKQKCKIDSFKYHTFTSRKNINYDVSVNLLTATWKKEVLECG